ncbi:MAG: hypothetical protein NWE95_08050 [Candidatus Bathyarchaeota archaeon]|nr:hypothetical protein [Candidatus Bathyarchaeota archaeon]
MRINGTLDARGSSDKKINFVISGSSDSQSAIQFVAGSTPWNEQTRSGSIMENAIITSTWGPTPAIQINNAEPKINNNTIFAGSATAIQVTSFGLPYGVSSTTSPVISNCTIHTNGYGIELDFCNATICNNNINCDFGIGTGGGYGSICGNVIYGSIIGIHSYDTNITIQNNLLVNNTTGIELGHYDAWWEHNSKAVLVNNTFSNNSHALQINGQLNPIITYNNFLNNQYNVFLKFEPPSSYSSSDINATYNWWGTTDTQTINQTIYDFDNDFTLGTVTFVPFLTSPNPDAPIIPELSSFVLVLSIIVVSIFALVSKKRQASKSVKPLSPL